MTERSAPRCEERDGEGQWAALSGPAGTLGVCSHSECSRAFSRVREQEDDLACPGIVFQFFSLFFAKKITLVPSQKMDWEETEDRASCGGKCRDGLAARAERAAWFPEEFDTRRLQTGTSAPSAQQVLLQEAPRKGACPSATCLPFARILGWGSSSRHEDAEQQPRFWPAHVRMLAAPEQATAAHRLPTWPLLGSRWQPAQPRPPTR